MNEPLRALWLADAANPVPVLLCTAIERVDCSSLVQAQAELLVAVAADDAQMTRYLDAIEALPMPRPALLAVGGTAVSVERAAALGVDHWLAAPPALPADWAAALRWTLLQHRRVAALQQRLDERRWTERAKGCLMAAQSLDEAQAHKLLRDTAMQARLQLTEVARSVVHASQLAEAVNRAGQQRMLSQRLVKLMAQRAAGIEAKRAKVLQDESAARLEANLARLAELLAEEQPGAALAPLREAWTMLAPCLEGKPEPAKLAAAAEAAGRLLDAAEALTQALVDAGARPPLRVLNLCGRQRLLSQRLAMNALLADAGAEAQARDEADFAAALDELDAAPLSDEPIRALLAEVREEWLRLLHALRHGGSQSAATALARASEQLLTQLDALTLRYQQSLQTLLA